MALSNSPFWDVLPDHDTGSRVSPDLPSREPVGEGEDVERRHVAPERSHLGSRFHVGDERVIGPADAANIVGGAVPRSGGCQRGPVPATQPWEVGQTGSAERLRSRRVERSPEGAYGRSSSSASSSERSIHSAASCDSYQEPKDRDVGKRLTEILGSLSLARDVVMPGRFDGSDGSSLRKFLDEFDAYFTAKFKGTDRQRAKELGRFLCGPARRAYDAMDGTNVRYRELRPRLLEWYRGERISSQRQAEDEFERAHLQQGDSLAIFALRMERIVRRAYPDSVREQERRLVRKFWTASPPCFRQVMSESQRGVLLATGKRKLTWQNIKQLAAAEDRQRRFEGRRGQSQECRSVMEVNAFNEWSRERTGGIFHGSAKHVDPTGATPKRPTPAAPSTFYNSKFQRSPPRGDRFQQRQVLCDWCGRPGHIEDTCWEKGGCCHGCGSPQHQRERCPRGIPTCSRCGGPHLGKYCAETEVVPLN
jgi:hypothetical protein